MATLPAFFKRTEAPAEPHAAGSRDRDHRLRAERDPFQLRALPQEDVFFYCKKIDNSRLVREADPQAARRLLVGHRRRRVLCWSC